MSTLEDKDKEGYKAVFKSTGIYGGVQVITIIINIIRSKLTALWLGTVGFGLLGVFNATVLLFSNISNVGLASSTVRDISQIHSQGDDYKLAVFIKAISRTVVVTGCLGALAMMGLSYYLSSWTLGNSNHIYSYMLLSIVVLFTNIYQGHYAILQGLRRIKSMALARVLGAVLGLVLMIPCYLLGGLRGIIPSLILSSFVALAISRFFTKKINTPKVTLKWTESIKHSKSTLKLGVMLMVAGLVASLAELIIKSYITQFGSLSQVGLYQAGWTLNVQYLGLIFTAMATDYYPRLTQVYQKKKTDKTSLAINQQSEVALLIMCPLICVMLVFLPTFTSILYTENFLEIVPMTRLLLIGSIIKAGAWAVSYLFLAAGNGKVYLVNEVGIKMINIPLYLFCYRFFGLIGIGYGYILNYLVYFIWVSFLAYKKYAFKHSMDFFTVLTWSLFFSILSLLSSIYIESLYFKFILGLVIISVSFYYSFRQLDQRISFKELIIKVKNKFRK